MVMAIGQMKRRRVYSSEVISTIYVLNQLKVYLALLL